MGSSQSAEKQYQDVAATSARRGSGSSAAEYYYDSAYPASGSTPGPRGGGGGGGGSTNGGGFAGPRHRRRRPFSYRLDARRFGRPGFGPGSGANGGGGGGGGPLRIRRGQLLTLYSGVTASRNTANNTLSALLFDTRAPEVTPQQSSIDGLFSAAYVDACHSSLAGQDVSRAFTPNEEFQAALGQRHGSCYQQSQAAVRAVTERYHHDILGLAVDLIDAEDRQLAAAVAERDGDAAFLAQLRSRSASAATGSSSSGGSPGSPFAAGLSFTAGGSAVPPASFAGAAAVAADGLLQQRLSEAWLHYTVTDLGRVVAWGGFFFCFWHSAVGEQHGQRECRAARWVLECGVPHLHVPLSYHVRYRGRGVTVLALVPIGEHSAAVTDQNVEVAAMAQQVASAFSLLPYFSNAPAGGDGAHSLQQQFGSVGGDGAFDTGGYHFLPPSVHTYLGRDGRYYFLQSRHWLPQWLSSRRAFDDYAQRLSCVTPRLLAARRAALSCRAFHPDAFIDESKGAIEFMKGEINHGLSELLTEERDAGTERAAAVARRQVEAVRAREEALERELSAGEEAVDDGDFTSGSGGGGAHDSHRGIAVPVFASVTSSVDSGGGPSTFLSRDRSSSVHSAHSVPRELTEAATQVLCWPDDDEERDHTPPTGRSSTTNSSGTAAAAAAALNPYPCGSIIRRFNRLGYPKSLLGALLIQLSCYPSPPLRHIAEVKREIMFRGLKASIRERMYEMRFGVQSRLARLPNVGGGSDPLRDMAGEHLDDNDGATADWGDPADGGGGSVNEDDEALWVDEEEWGPPPSLHRHGWGRLAYDDDDDDRYYNGGGGGARRSISYGRGGRRGRHRRRAAAGRRDSGASAEDEGFAAKLKKFGWLFIGKPQATEGASSSTRKSGGRSRDAAKGRKVAAKMAAASASGKGPKGHRKQSATRRRFLAFFGLSDTQRPPQAGAAEVQPPADDAASGGRANPLTGRGSPPQPPDTPDSTSARSRARTAVAEKRARSGTLGPSASTLASARAASAAAAPAGVRSRWPDFATVTERVLVAFMQYGGGRAPEVLYSRASIAGPDPAPSGDDTADAMEESAMLNDFFLNVVMPRVYRKFRLTPRLVDLYAPLEEDDKRIVYERLCAALGVRMTSGSVTDAIPTVKSFAPKSVALAAVDGRPEAATSSARGSLDSSSPPPSCSVGGGPECLYTVPLWVRLRTRALVERLVLPQLLRPGAVHQREWELNGSALISLLGVRAHCPGADDTPQARAVWERVGPLIVSTTIAMATTSSLLCHALECCRCSLESPMFGSNGGLPDDDGTQVPCAIFTGAVGVAQSAGESLERAVELRSGTARTVGDKAALFTLMQLQVRLLVRAAEELRAADIPGRTAASPAAALVAASLTPSHREAYARRYRTKIANRTVEVSLLADQLLGLLGDAFGQQYRGCTAELVECLPAITDTFASGEGILGYSIDREGHSFSGRSGSRSEASPTPRRSDPLSGGSGSAYTTATSAAAGLVLRFTSEGGAVRHMLRQVERYCSQDLLLAQDYTRQAVIMAHWQQAGGGGSSGGRSAQRRTGSGLLPSAHFADPNSHSQSQSFLSSSALLSSCEEHDLSESIVLLLQSAYAIFVKVEGKNGPCALRALASLALYLSSIGEHGKWHEVLQLLRSSWRDGGPDDIKQMLISTYPDYLASRHGSSVGGSSTSPTAASAADKQLQWPRLGPNASLLQSWRGGTIASGSPGSLGYLSGSFFSSPLYSQERPPVRFIHLENNS